MASELCERLKSTLGNAYTLERELSGGGMSRVFVARETSLGRHVVVKVLPPDLAAGVSVNRFKREIQLAAQLQHPHIVPVLAAGETDGLPFYTMPLVEGESLRTRLSRGDRLPITEVLGILRDVAKALAYAHDHGVVHRDIKPDNVILTGGSAVVVDFGIAKAVSASMADGDAATGGVTLTMVGTALGTPTYMAPEQAAADPQTDSRADLYAFGCMAYELLAGRAPFHGLTPQRLLAAKMSERPEPVQQLRTDVPPLLAQLVMCCLEAEPDRRVQSATAIGRVLDAMATGGTRVPAMAAALLAGSGRFRRALAWYAVAFVTVPLSARAAVIEIGLPDWVFLGALAVMLLGLPVILFTGYVHHTTRRVLTATPTLTPGGTPLSLSPMAGMAVRASSHVTFRRAAVGGVAAVGVFMLLVGSYMTLRAVGIGPAGSLLASGAIAPNERVLVADFGSPGLDTMLGPVISEAFRAGLGQSRSISVLQPTAVREVLRRMQRSPASRLDFRLAREIAAREGVKAVVDGEVLGLGGSYLVSVRLVAAQSGDVLASFRETADGANGLLPAVDRLSKDLRVKIGESLKLVRAAPPLEWVTTSSLEALRKYVYGSRAISAGQIAKGVALLEEAIALDTGFAMAYRRLAGELSNHGNQRARVAALLQKAYAHRNRLSDAERYLTIGTYYQAGANHDAAKAIAAYEALLDIQPNNATALTNAALLYRGLRNPVKAEEYARRAMSAGPPAWTNYTNLIIAQIMLGKVAEAEQAVERFVSAMPGAPNAGITRARFAFMRGEYDRAERSLREVRLGNTADASVRDVTARSLAVLGMTLGRLAEARRWMGEARDAQRERGVAHAPLLAELDEAFRLAWFLGEADRAVMLTDAALARHPLDSVPPADRPYAAVVDIYALAGRGDRARAIIAEFEKRPADVRLQNDEELRHRMLGDVAMAEGRFTDAVREYRESDRGACVICALPNIARAYDLAGNADSAIAVYTRYIETPALQRDLVDGRYLAGAHKRLGELYELRGDRQRAASHYTKFVELWERADPELQPKVAAARARAARLKTTAQR